MTQTFARVIDGVVLEIVSLPDGANVADCFHADIAVSLIACDATVQQGWIYTNEAFSAPAPQAATTPDLIAYAASKRFEVETGGIFVDGAKIATDRASQSLITGAYNYVQANPDVVVKFKTIAGFIELTAAQVTGIANAVGAHVQACFATESVVAEEIGTGAISGVAEIDAAAWPANA